MKPSSIGGGVGRADADRVDPHAERARRLRGDVGRRLAGVVGAVGDEHDRARLRRQLLELAQGERERGADGGAVGQESDVHPIEHLAEQVGIGGERRLEEGAAGEDHEADEIALTPPRELGEHAARDLEPVAGLEVRRLHAARDVQRDHDVARLAADLLHVVRLLRPCERHDEKRETADPERVGQPAPARRASHGRVVEKAERRESDPVRGRSAAMGPQFASRGPGARRAAAGTRDQRIASAVSCQRRSSSRVSRRWAAAASESGRRRANFTRSAFVST